MRLHTLLCVILLTLVSCSPGSSKSLSLHGKPWWPLGQNVAWIEDDDPHTYDYYFQRLSESGVELVRIVLVPWGLHEGWNASGEPDENRLSELEETLQMAADYNLSVILALDIYGELRSASEDPREMLWEENPYNAVRGGPLHAPAEFFTNSSARESYKWRLARLAARLGDEKALYAWEFWNEVDLTDGYNETAVCAWHQEMAQFLDELDDADRQITTSFADFKNGDCIWKLPEIDLVMVHYHGPDVLDRIPEMYHLAARYGKPVLLEEFSLGNSPEAVSSDPIGEHLRRATVAARDTGYASGPMSWWWDVYVDQNELYWIYRNATIRP